MYCEKQLLLWTTEWIFGVREAVLARGIGSEVDLLWGLRERESIFLSLVFGSCSWIFHGERGVEEGDGSEEVENW